MNVWKTFACVGAIALALSGCIFYESAPDESGLSGTLLTSSGDPIANALVRVYPDTGDSMALAKTAGDAAITPDSTWTDANGRFRFPKLKHGRCNLECTLKKNGDTQTIFIPRIELKERCDLGTRKSLAPGNILIRVQSETGDFLGGVQCDIPGTSYSAISDTSGKCFILCLPPETFRVRLQKEGFATGLSSALEVVSGKTTNGGIVTLHGNHSSLVAYWNFDEGSGTLLRDRTLNGHDGTVGGGSPAWAEDGISGGSLHFDDSLYVQVPASPAFSGMESFTFSAWVWQDIQDMDEPVMEFSQVGALTGSMLWVNTSGFEIVIPGSVMGCYRNLSGASGYVYNTPGDIAPKSQWNHLGLIYDNPTHSSRIYVNGVLQASYTIPMSYTPSKAGPLYLGLRPRSSAESRAGAYFRGRMDEVRVYSAALSDAEIEALYSAAGH